jgi:hypothetical protein
LHASPAATLVRDQAGSQHRFAALRRTAIKSSGCSVVVRRGHPLLMTT